ncbi:MAG: ATPase P [Desulfobacteraceae bacterium]|nr:ATPase P [Desulfobacteraceae bacterium]
MIDIAIPGFGELHLAHLVMDYNGTLAVDGRLMPGVAQRFKVLSKELALHVITADTFGRVKAELDGLDLTLRILPQQHQDQAKLEYVQQLGANTTVAVGNGRNDRLMLQEAALGIAVILSEGAAGKTLAAADVICTSIEDALDLLCQPLRLTATIRC